MGGLSCFAKTSGFQDYIPSFFFTFFPLSRAFWLWHNADYPDLNKLLFRGGRFLIGFLPGNERPSVFIFREAWETTHTLIDSCNKSLQKCCYIWMKVCSHAHETGANEFWFHTSEAGFFTWEGFLNHYYLIKWTILFVLFWSFAKRNMWKRRNEKKKAT